MELDPEICRVEVILGDYTQIDSGIVSTFSFTYAEEKLKQFSLSISDKDAQKYWVYIDSDNDGLFDSRLFETENGENGIESIEMKFQPIGSK